MVVGDYLNYPKIVTRSLLNFNQPNTTEEIYRIRNPKQIKIYLEKRRRTRIAHIRPINIHFMGLKSPGTFPVEIGAEVKDGVGIGSGKSCGTLISEYDYIFPKIIPMPPPQAASLFLSIWWNFIVGDQEFHQFKEWVCKSRGSILSAFWIRMK
jgi:hypothetical protein